MSVVGSYVSQSTIAQGLVEAVFAEKREIGMSFEERTAELPGQPGVGQQWLTVTGIKPNGQAALNPGLHAGMVVHSIGDQEVHTLKGPAGEAAIQLMQQRPVVFRFWSVPAADDHHAAMSSRGSSVGSAAAGGASNPYIQPAAQQQGRQSQPLEPVPEQAQMHPPLQQQHHPQHGPLQPTSSSVPPTNSYARPGAIAQIDQHIGALHRSHSATPPGQPGSDYQANQLIGLLQSQMRELQMELQHAKDREAAAVVAQGLAPKGPAPPPSAYSMGDAEQAQALAETRLALQQQQDEVVALKDALRAERESSSRYQQENTTLRDENYSLEEQNDELAGALEEALGGDGGEGAGAGGGATPLPPPPPRPTNGGAGGAGDDDSASYRQVGRSSPSAAPSVAEQLAQLQRRDARGALLSFCVSSSLCFGPALRNSLMLCVCLVAQRAARGSRPRGGPRPTPRLRRCRMPRLPPRRRSSARRGGPRSAPAR